MGFQSAQEKQVCVLCMFGVHVFICMIFLVSILLGAHLVVHDIAVELATLPVYVLVHPNYALITGHLPWHKKNETGPPKRHLMHVERCLTRCKVTK